LKVVAYEDSEFKILFFFFYYCFAGWGYIVTFTKVLTIYQIYHTWIHPLHHSAFTTPFPHASNSFNKYHFSIYICVHNICTIFMLLHHFSTFSPLTLVPCSALLLSDFVKEKYKIFVCKIYFPNFITQYWSHIIAITKL
jgi:hypothetical protein